MKPLIVLIVGITAMIMSIGFMIGTLKAIGNATEQEPQPGINVTNVCPAEDGDPSGQPCVWTNPTTGNKYISDSSEYRD